MPFATRFIVVLSIMLYVYSWINYYPVYLVAALPKGLIEDHAFSQFFTFPFQHLGLAHLVFALISYIPMAIEAEKRDGTAKYLLKFVIFNLVIGNLHTVTLYLYATTHMRYYNYYMYFPCAGLWPINLVHMVERFSENGDKDTEFLYLPFMVKARWYPLCFLCFWWLVVGYIWEHILGAVVGYLSKAYLGMIGGMNRLIFHSSIVKGCERFCSSFFKVFGGFSRNSAFKFKHLPQESFDPTVDLA